VTIPKRVAVTEVSHWHSVNDASYMCILRDLGCDIVGVSDRSARIAGERVEQFGGTPFIDYRQMIEATKPEFVIALGRHCDMPEIFRFLVDAGVPFVMEKPWGTDPETVADLARLAAAKGAWVGVPFMSRYSFWAVTVKRMIEAGECGQVARRRRSIAEPRRTRLRHGAVYYRRGAAGRVRCGQPAGAWWGSRRLCAGDIAHPERHPVSQRSRLHDADLAGQPDRRRAESGR
jgi:predicted dehydrogenase